jgi:hypothetical protein
MGKVYKNNYLELTLNTLIDLTGVVTTKIRIKNPKGIQSEVTATVLSDNQSLFYAFPSGALDEDGNYTFWSYVYFSETNYSIGEPVQLRVYNEIE